MSEIAEIIKYEGDNTTFVWKHPKEDFNSLTQLIVHENQEAVFYRDGQALDLFGPGRYMLETGNIPKIGKFLDRATGDKTPFHCEVYFVNKTEQPAIKWGTDSKIEYVEPTYNFPIKIGASGEMTLRAEDSRKLLVKLVGTEKALTQSTIVQKFRAFLMTKFKAYMANYIRDNTVDIFRIDERLGEISEAMQSLLEPDFREYGAELKHFFVTTIVKPEDDRNYIRFRDLHFRKYAEVAEAKLKQQTDLIYAETEAQKVVIDSKAQAQKRVQEGYTYAQERGFDVAGDVARNEASGQFANMGIGLGVMAGVGGTVGGILTESLNNTASAASKTCAKCGKPLPEGAKFCLECGGKVEESGSFICPNCGKSVPVGKFCPECGYKLQNNCKKCGAPLPGGAKFCLECGEKTEEE